MRECYKLPNKVISLKTAPWQIKVYLSNVAKEQNSYNKSL